MTVVRALSAFLLVAVIVAFWVALLAHAAGLESLALAFLHIGRALLIALGLFLLPLGLALLWLRVRARADARLGMRGTRPGARVAPPARRHGAIQFPGPIRPSLRGAAGVRHRTRSGG